MQPRLQDALRLPLACRRKLKIVSLQVRIRVNTAEHDKVLLFFGDKRTFSSLIFSAPNGGCWLGALLLQNAGFRGPCSVLRWPCLDGDLHIANSLIVANIRLASPLELSPQRSIQKATRQLEANHPGRWNLNNIEGCDLFPKPPSPCLRLRFCFSPS